MNESYLSEFRELVRTGATSQDIHDATKAVAFAARADLLDDAYVQREVERVAAHQRCLVPLLEHFVGPVQSILDVGSSSGGTTVALALSPVLGATEVIGVDPNTSAIGAARIRAAMHGLGPERIRFEPIVAGDPLPFPEDHFDMVSCVSVLEFVTSPPAREYLVTELQRVTRAGGHIFLATPNPWRLREFHSRRWFGSFRQRAGFPWSSTAAAIRRMFRECEPIALDEFALRNLLERRRIPGATALAALAPWLMALLPWQKLLFRKPV